MKKSTSLVFLLLLAAFRLSAQCSISFVSAATPYNNTLLNYEFTNTSSVTTNGNATTSVIYFGDGASQSMASGFADHIYTTPGAYSVKLVVRRYNSTTNVTYCLDSSTQSVNIAYAPAQTAVFGYRYPASNPLSYAFKLYEPGATGFVNYSFNYGDGTTGTSLSHVYATAGTYHVTLTSNSISPYTTYVNHVTINTASPLPTCNNTDSFATTTNGLQITGTNLATNVANAGMFGHWVFLGPTFNERYGLNTSFTAPTAGIYQVSRAMTWYDTGTNMLLCYDSVVHGTVTLAANPCANNHAAFTSSISNNSVLFSNGSATGSSMIPTAHWDFGDGSTSTSYAVNHTFAATGTYTVKLVMTWTDSTNSSIICSDSVSHTVTISSVNVTNFIQGTIHLDSIAAPSVYQITTWLIRYDSTTNLLTAVDSFMISAQGSCSYLFTNKPGGTYRVKAAVMSAQAPGIGYVPTYRDSSIYWSSAVLVQHTGAGTINQDIWMKRGIVTTGPGFVGGNVSLGANKGASAGVPGISVFLLNSAGKLISASTTDGNGNFSMNNIPVGTYSIYPEHMNYATTAYANIVIGATVSAYTNINFNQDNSKMSIKPRSATGIAGAPDKAIITLYPNPAKGAVTLSWKGADLTGAQVIITDLAGQVVYNHSIPASAAMASVLNVSSLQPGMYFVRVKNGSTEMVQKLIVQ